MGVTRPSIDAQILLPPISVSTFPTFFHIVPHIAYEAYDVRSSAYISKLTVGDDEGSAIERMLAVDKASRISVQNVNRTGKLVGRDRFVFGIPV